MADIVNLRQFRKQKHRVDKNAAADQNRAIHGRTKVEKARDTYSADKFERFLDGHRRDEKPGGNGAE